MKLPEPNYLAKPRTKTKIKRITQKVIDKDIVYSRESAKKGSNINSTMYSEVTDGIVETMAKRDPEKWEISTDDLRFYYALGVTYGMNDHPDWSGTDSDVDETTDTEEEH